MIPQLRAWHERHAHAGLTIIGVHSPEFFREKSTAAVTAAVREFGIRYPVVQDNDFVIWKQFATRYWPSAVLVDRTGVIRYAHIGEGATEETETMIRTLLAEQG